MPGAGNRLIGSIVSNSGISGHRTGTFQKKIAVVYLSRVAVRLIRERHGFAAQFEPRNKEDLSVGLSYRWVIVGAGALMTCVGIGAMSRWLCICSRCRWTRDGRAPGFQAQ
jgi:hypothetical protein